MVAVGPPITRAKTLPLSALLPQFKAIRNNVLSFLQLLSKKMGLGTRCFEKAARLLDQFILRKPSCWSKAYFYCAVSLHLSAKLHQKDEKVLSLQMLRESSSLTSVQIVEFEEAEREIMTVLDYQLSFQTLHDWMHYLLSPEEVKLLAEHIDPLHFLDELSEKFTLQTDTAEDPRKVSTSILHSLRIIIGAKAVPEHGRLSSHQAEDIIQEHLRPLRVVVAAKTYRPVVLKQDFANTMRNFSNGTKVRQNQRMKNQQDRTENQVRPYSKIAGHRSGERFMNATATLGSLMDWNKGADQQRKRRYDYLSINRALYR